MTFEHQHTHVHRQVAHGTSAPTLADPAGATVEFLTLPEDSGDSFTIMRGVLAPGAVVPLHSHDECEAFFILKGSQNVLTQGADGLEWSEFHAGDYVNVPPGTLHAHRNTGDEPAVDLIVTTPRMARFFQEISTPPGDGPEPPTPEDLARLAAAATRYGWRLGTPEENQALGIELPKF